MDSGNWEELAVFAKKLARMASQDHALTPQQQKILGHGLRELASTYQLMADKPCCGQRFGHLPTCPGRPENQ